VSIQDFAVSHFILPTGSGSRFENSICPWHRNWKFLAWYVCVSGGVEGGSAGGSASGGGGGAGGSTSGGGSVGASLGDDNSV
jgi:hypothetical protein